jgi:hypothetical protein
MRNCRIAKFTDANRKIPQFLQFPNFAIPQSRNPAILFLIDGKPFLLPLVKTTQ